MSQTKQTTSSNETTQELNGLSGELLIEENMENSNGIMQTNIMNGGMNRVPESTEASSHNTALSFVSGPTFTTGSVPSVTLQGSPTAYIPIQVPGVIETAFTQTPAFAAPLIYPSALTAAYITGPTPPASPCTFLSAAAPITAVCHCIYAQPCALHHRPITYASHSLSSLGTVPATLSQSHSHTLPATIANNVASARVSSLPPTLTLPSLRSSMMRLKRSGEQLATNHLPVTDPDSSANIRLQKIRRVEPGAEATTSYLTSQRHIEAQGDERSTVDNRSSLNSTICCDCRSRTTYQCPYQSCPYHHHHICPRHPMCFCQRNESGTSYRRETDMNPVHDLLLSSRIAQIERQQQANNLWFQRHSLASSNLIGVDIVPRRLASQPIVFLPRHHQPIMELAMVLLQPHDPTVILGSNVPTSNDPLPIGATVEQINRFSTTYKYVKENDIPENEQERCTVCLNDFETDEEVRALRCNHVFHVVCIDRWLVYNKKCPVCRLDLDKTNVV
ncbi:zinc finger, C3HC4 type [Onchocerca flexuosa]|uniref:RING-type E3 ubiquitin transferase n=1 Tax=Onchocerca flexuosa TaxID=387005 RepID=A0A238BVJ7_9BILA|nr:zinc finger, C3HC4 type [Onchocerca flexuosa]